MPRLQAAAEGDRRRLAKLASGADYADVCSRTLRRWGADGRITLYRAGPRLLLVDLDELDAMLRPITTVGR